MSCSPGVNGVPPPKPLTPLPPTLLLLPPLPVRARREGVRVGDPGRCGCCCCCCDAASEAFAFALRARFACVAISSLCSAAAATSSGDSASNLQNHSKPTAQ